MSVAGLNGLALADSNPLLEAGINSYQKGNYDDAQSNFIQLITNPRWSFAALYNLGNVAARQKHLGEALAYYERALQKRPHDKDVLFNIKFVEEALGTRRFAGKLTNYELLRENFLTRFSFSEFLVALFVFSLIFLISLLNFLKRRKVLKTEESGPVLPTPASLASGAILIILTVLTILKIVDSYSERGVVTTAKIDLRSGPGETNASMQEVQEGTEVGVLDSSGDWKQVTFPSRDFTGWVPSKSLMLTSGGGPF